MKRQRYFRLAMLITVPHWVIARAIGQRPYDPTKANRQEAQAQALGRIYGADAA